MQEKDLVIKGRMLKRIYGRRPNGPYINGNGVIQWKLLNLSQARTHISNEMIFENFIGAAIAFSKCFQFNVCF